jgi:molybdopterin-containing oxidoreductase family molybdopterin binding subunit
MRSFEKEMLLSRRTVLASIAGAMLAGCSRSADDESITIENPVYEPGDSVKEDTFVCACRSNCQSNCHIIAHKRNGKIVKTSIGHFLPNGFEIGGDGSLRTIPLSQAQDAYSSYDRICLRGLSQVQRLYSSSRLLYPLKQTGERGDVNGFVRITWQEAIETIAQKIKDLYVAGDPNILGKYICSFTASGNYGVVHGGAGAANILGNMLNTTKIWTSLDMALPAGLSKVMGLGTFPFITGNELRDVKKAKNLFLWGSNMAEAQMMGWAFVHDGRKENGGTIENVVSIDVMLNTTSAKSDYFFAIRPGSDTMVALAMINDIIARNLHDTAFLKENTCAPFLLLQTGTDYTYLRKAHFTGLASDTELVVWNSSAGDVEYITPPTPSVNARAEIGAAILPDIVIEQSAGFGPESGFSVTLAGVGAVTVKTAFQYLKEKVALYTPAYATDYTNISAADLKNLTDIYVDGPTTIYLGFGTSHHFNSHNFGHAVATLASITGNIGKEGASVGNFFSRTTEITRAVSVPARTRTPYYLMGPQYADGLRGIGNLSTEIQKIKLILIANGNPVSNYVNSKSDYIDTIFSRDHTDLIVVHDYDLNDTARYADIVLPAAHWFEVEDMLNGSKYPFIVYQEKVVDAPGEVKSDMNFTRLLAERLYDLIPSLQATIDTYFYKTFEGRKVFKTDWDYIEECLTPLIPTTPRITPLNLKTQKVVRWQDPANNYVSLVTNHADPSNTKITTTSTPTGKLEFFCFNPRIFALLAVPHDPVLVSSLDISKEYFPEWISPDESWNGPGASPAQLDIASRYPLIYMQEHTKWRVHTQWTEIPWLRELDPEPILKINPSDAEDYGNIQTGDLVRIINDRGQAVFRAIITAALPKGMINVPKGWQRYKNLEAFKTHPNYDMTHDGGYNDLTNPKINTLGVDMIFYDARVKIEKL